MYSVNMHCIIWVSILEKEKSTSRGHNPGEKKPLLYATAMGTFPNVTLAEITRRPIVAAHLQERPVSINSAWQQLQQSAGDWLKKTHADYT